MAERKLLQGGDILGWQYGDVKCILGGGGGGGEEEERRRGGEGTRSLKGHKLLVGADIHAHVHRYRHILK